LEQVSSASYSLQSCEEIVLGNDISAACSALTDMEAVMAALPRECSNSIANSGVVYAMLKREANIIRSRFTSRLRRLLNDFIQISRGRIVVSKALTGIIRSENTLLSSELLLDDVWAALVQMARSNLEEIVRNILQDVWTCVVFPLWREKKPLTPRINSHGTPAEYVVDFTSSTDAAMNQPSDLDNGLNLISLSLSADHALSPLVFSLPVLSSQTIPMSAVG
jgi:hypothetical protein